MKKIEQVSAELNPEELTLLKLIAYFTSSVPQLVEVRFPGNGAKVETFLRQVLKEL